MIGQSLYVVFFFQAEDGIRDKLVTGVQTCALPIFRPRGARLECACARNSRHCPSNSCHTGLQYRAVDSITTSRTLRSASQADNSRTWLAVVPNLRRSNRSGPWPATSAATTASMLLCTSIEPTQYEVSVAISLSFRCNWQPSGRACENFLLSTVSYCRRSGPTETPAHTHSLKSCPRSDTHSTSTSSLPRRPRPDAATTSDTPVFITIREPLGSLGHA